MLIKNLIVTTLLIVLLSVPAVSFQISTSDVNVEKSEYSLTIQEENFSCFQNLNCLIKDSPLTVSNLNQIRFNSNNYQKFIVEGTSKNEEIYAVYDRNGQLIEAIVTQRNIILPGKITRSLVTGEFKNWVMIGNELVVQNFDKNSMLYKIVLQKGDEVRVEYFDRNGNHRNRLS